MVSVSRLKRTSFTRFALVLLFLKDSCEFIVTGTGEITGTLRIPLAGIRMVSEFEISKVSSSFSFLHPKEKRKTAGRRKRSFFI
jgi:hypothetical protein